MVSDVVTDGVRSADADPAADSVALCEAATGASVPVPVSVADEDCAALRDAAAVGVPVVFAVGVSCAVPVPDTVRVPVAVVDGVAVVVGEPVALAVVEGVPVIDSADEMVRVVDCEEVMAAVELAVFEMDREPEYDAESVLVSVRIDVALPLAVCVLVGLALGARKSTSVASVSRRPVSRQLAIALPPP